jgi:23S rRNA C2498 (ribose-2'-O)-methylase RlmM
MGNSAPQQDSHVRPTPLELTGKDTSEMIISKLKKCPTKSLIVLELSEVNITNETLMLCSKFVNPIKLYLYQCTFVNPEINLEKYLDLKDLILVFTYSTSLNLKNLRIKFCKGLNMWKFMDSALVEIL